MNELAFPVAPANSNISYGASILDPRPIGDGTYTSWPGGVDPSVPLYAGNPVPLSMGSTQSGGRRRASRKNSRKSSRKNRMLYRKATRQNRMLYRKATRKNRVMYRKKNSRVACRKNTRKASRKNNRRN